MQQINLKDKDYSDQRFAVREYKGERSKHVSYKREQALTNIVNTINGVQLMQKLGWTPGEVTVALERLVQDGHLAYEKIYGEESDLEPIALKAIDPIYLVPSYVPPEVQGMPGRSIWKQYLGGSNNRALLTTLDEHQVLYLTSREVFDETVAIIVKEEAFESLNQ